jgi:hypothetical protein
MDGHVLSIQSMTHSQQQQQQQQQQQKQEYIYSYPDGTVYMGHMLNNQRHGRGTLRTPAFVYGDGGGRSYTSDEAEENAHLAKWHEYAGTWENDKLHGYGVHVQKSGNGAEIVIFEGEWNNGKPTKSIHSKYRDDGNDSDNGHVHDDTVFG